MSREQWGHGYHKGIEDVKSGKKCDYKYVIKLNGDGEMTNAYMIWGQMGDTYILEDLVDILALFHLTGMTCAISEAEDDTEISDICQLTRSELSEFHEPIFCINQKTFWAYVIKDAKLCDKRWRQKQERGEE